MSIIASRSAALFTAALVLCAASAAAAGTPRAVTPLGNPGNWVTTEDYPSRALRYEEQGVVGFLLTIGTDGVPLSCKVTQTSNSEALDTQTCNLLMERARFRPAADASGRAAEGTYRSSVRWTIPLDAPTEIGPAEMIVSFEIGPDGLAKDCKVDKVAGVLPFPASEPCGPRDRFAVPVGKDGKPIARRVKMRVVVEVENVPTGQ